MSGELSSSLTTTLPYYLLTHFETGMKAIVIKIKEATPASETHICKSMRKQVHLLSQLDAKLTTPSKPLPMLQPYPRSHPPAEG
mmetsp:Transcript_17772/g.46588  ORF Transcript_17772/g.46588 Transcript_17772/m.46588 type:complete len:84 (+) Transcript_17772:1144-1395(+)